MNTRILLVGIELLLSLPAVAAVQVGFQNGTFDSPGVPDSFPMMGLTVNSTFITGWTTVPGHDGTFSGSVEYISEESENPKGHWVEVGYYFGINAIEQTFGTSPGQAYSVSFLLATNAYNGPAALLRVAASGKSADFQATPGSGDQRAMDWKQESFEFTADSSGATTLWFGSLTGTAAIDTVTVTAIPELNTYLLAAIGALVFIRRTRR